MKSLSYKKQIEKIMDEFDFIRVHRCMKAMNWTWVDKGVPSIEHLKECARDLLKECKKKRGYAVATGGFIVSCDGRHLTMTFYIEQVYGYEEQ